MKTVLALLLFVVGACAEPYLPANDSVVLEKVPSDLKPARRTNDLAAACGDARKFIDLARKTAEPRYLGYAQGTLWRWINLSPPPSEVLFLRAIIRQSNHDFDGSLNDLDALLKHSPRDRATLLAKISVLQAQGRISAAKTICQKAPWLASDMVGLTTVAAAASLSGQLQSSITLLKRALETTPDIAWAWTTFAEMAVRAGNTNESNAAFSKALALTADDPYLLAAYSDFLLDSSEPRKVIDLLGLHSSIDGLLLRLAIAEKLATGDFKKHKSELEQRYSATRVAAGDLHAREEAMLNFHLLDCPARALQLAQTNWQKQREPADARILLESALAIGDSHAAESVFAWMDQTKIEDVRLIVIRRKFNHLTAASR